MNDAECDDRNHCTIDSCNISTKECVNELSFHHCRTFGEPRTLAIRVKAKDAETTKSVDDIKSMIFGIPNASFSAQSQLNLCSYQQFKPIAYEGSEEEFTNGVSEVIVDMNIIDQQTSVVENAAMNALKVKFGALNDKVDLLMLFLPAGTLTAGTADWKVSNLAAVNNHILIQFSTFPSRHTLS